MRWNKADRVPVLIKEHLARRPAMEPCDLYKLLYQGVRGPEHLISSPEAFTERLVKEWHELDFADGDPLWESIRPDGSLLRLNLRPFKAAGGKLDELATACLETGRRRWGTLSELQKSWEYFITTCRDDYWPGLPLDELETFTSWLKEKGFPAVHHSESYQSLYRPAYRLVAADIRYRQKLAGWM
jgi:hypothetical protein